MIYSPSSTDAHLRCPLFRRYTSVEHWRLRALGKRDLAAVMSVGIHAGLAHWLNPAELNRDSEAVAHREVEAELAHLAEHGCEWDSALQRDVWMLPTRAAEVTSKVMAWRPDESAAWLPKVTATELVLENYGDCRIDVVCEDEQGPFPLDWKVKQKYDARYDVADRARYTRSRQMYHYAWALGKHLNTTILRYAIGQIIVNPFSVEVLRYDIPRPQVGQWLLTSLETWTGMSHLDSITRNGGDCADNWTACETQYGPCDFMGACWDYHRDRTMMELTYTKVPRRK